MVARVADGHKLQREVAECWVLCKLSHLRVELQVKHAGTQHARRLACDLPGGSAARRSVGVGRQGARGRDGSGVRGGV